MGARKHSYDTDEDIARCLHDQTFFSRTSGIAPANGAASGRAPPVRSGVVPSNHLGPERTSPAIPRAAGVPMFVVGVRPVSPDTSAPRRIRPAAALLGGAAFLAAVVIAAVVHYG